VTRQDTGVRLFLRTTITWYLLACLLVALAITLLGCQRDAFPLQMQSRIEEYASRELLGTRVVGSVFAAVDIFGSRDVDQGKSYVFAWCLVAEVQPDLSIATAASMPIKFTVERGPLGDRVVGHRVPLSGSLYWESIKDIFPVAYHRAIRNFPHQTSDREQRLLAKAREHFKR